MSIHRLLQILISPGQRLNIRSRSSWSKIKGLLINNDGRYYLFDDDSGLMEVEVRQSTKHQLVLTGMTVAGKEFRLKLTDQPPFGMWGCRCCHLYVSVEGELKWQGAVYKSGLEESVV